MQAEYAGKEAPITLSRGEIRPNEETQFVKNPVL